MVLSILCKTGGCALLWLLASIQGTTAFVSRPPLVPTSHSLPPLKAGVEPSTKQRAQKLDDPTKTWVPDPMQFAYGLPGSTAPVPYFDPVGFAQFCTYAEMKRYREAEVTHGRVAMLAAVGIPVAESFHPLFGGGVVGPAIDHLGQVRAVAPEFFEALVLCIGIAETGRALVGWAPPNEFKGKQFLKQEYYPGNLGFDPLRLRPQTAHEYDDMQTKELQHGRLAMLGTVGMVAQEIVTHKPLFVL